MARGRNQEQGQRLAALLELVEQRERGLAGVGREDAIVGSVLAAQIALDGFEDFGVVVNRQQDRLCHRHARR
jgi:hypothetical protein